MTYKQNKIKNAIILAGGKGTRLSEQTVTIPKPLIRVGPDPAIIHIIRHFVSHGVRNIYIAGGYKFALLAKELEDYFTTGSLSSKNKNISIITDKEDPIYKANIRVVDTGYNADTAERIKKVLKYLPENDKATFITYGDTFSDVDLYKVSEQLFSDDESVATLTAVNFTERFGILKLSNNNKVSQFSEKSQSEDEFINGGFIACRENLDDYLLDTDGDFSRDTLPRLQREELLTAYKHSGFWFAMDSQRDWEEINKYYKENPEKFSY